MARVSAATPRAVSLPSRSTHVGTVTPDEPDGQHGGTLSAPSLETSNCVTPPIDVRGTTSTAAPTPPGVRGRSAGRERPPRLTRGARCRRNGPAGLPRLVRHVRLAKVDTPTRGTPPGFVIIAKSIACFPGSCSGATRSSSPLAASGLVSSVAGPPAATPPQARSG